MVRQLKLIGRIEIFIGFDEIDLSDHGKRVFVSLVILFRTFYLLERGNICSLPTVIYLRFRFDSWIIIFFRVLLLLSQNWTFIRYK